MVTASLLWSFMNLGSRERELTTLLYTLMTYLRHVTLVTKLVVACGHIQRLYIAS